MNWRAYPDYRPENSGTYLISVTRPYHSNEFVFNCVAHYDAENQNWRKYDGFDDESIKEKITDKVNGWIPLTAYMG
jgi:hypothetical protein